MSSKLILLKQGFLLL